MHRTTCCETKEHHRLILDRLLPGASETSLKGGSYTDHRDKETLQSGELAAKQVARGSRDAIAQRPKT